jgi:hypothetical protein
MNAALLHAKKGCDYAPLHVHPEYAAAARRVARNHYSMLTLGRQPLRGAWPAITYA